MSRCVAKRQPFLGRVSLRFGEEDVAEFECGGGLLRTGEDEQAVGGHGVGKGSAVLPVDGFGLEGLLTQIT